MSLPNIVWPEAADANAEAAASCAILATLESLATETAGYLAIPDPPPLEAQRGVAEFPSLQWGKRGYALVFASRKQFDALKMLFEMRADYLTLLAIPAGIPSTQWSDLVAQFMATQESVTGVTGLVFEWGQLIEVVVA